MTEAIADILGIKFQSTFNRNLELNVVKQILLRESRLSALFHKLTSLPFNAAIIDMLPPLRLATVSVVESIESWRGEDSFHSQPTPFYWEGVNYLQKMITDVDFLGDCIPFARLLKLPPHKLRRNPLMLAENLEEAIRDSQSARDKAIKDAGGMRSGHYFHEKLRIRVAEQILINELRWELNAGIVEPALILGAIDVDPVPEEDASLNPPPPGSSSPKIKGQSSKLPRVDAQLASPLSPLNPKFKIRTKSPLPEPMRSSSPPPSSSQPSPVSRPDLVQGRPIQRSGKGGGGVQGSPPGGGQPETRMSVVLPVVPRLSMYDVDMCASIRKPPKKLRVAAGVVVVLLSGQGEVPEDLSWRAFQAMVSSCEDFADQMNSFDPKHVPSVSVCERECV